MKTPLRNVLIIVAAASVISTAGCSKLFKKTVLPSPYPSVPPVQLSCVTGIDFQSSQRRAQALTQATITMDSNPRGLQVEVNGAYIGATPRSTTPPYSNALNKITILNQSGGSNYQVCYSQVASAAATVFYNRSADTSGKITTIQDIARSSQSNLVSENSVRRTPAVVSLTNAVSSSSTIEVRYRASALMPARHSAAIAESAANVSDGQDISPRDASVLARVVHVREGEAIGSAIARLRANANVLSAEPVQFRYTKTTTPIAPPNDPHFSNIEQWDMYQIGMLNAWAYTLGSPTIKVAVIDTGLDTRAANTMVQADLVSKLDYSESVLTPNCNGTQVVTPGQAAVQDADGHGTNVAGIATALPNNGAGFAGVGWNVKLQVYKIFDPSGNACTSDEAKAIFDAVANGARVINLSLGSAQGGGPDQTEFDAIQYAIAHNVFVVAAAGNERAQQTENIDFPAAYKGVMAVGATSLSDGGTGNPVGAKEVVASYSNSGPGLGVVAPGGDPAGTSDNDKLHWISNLYSTTGTPPCSTPSNCYVLIAGTSQATPHVAGAAALLLSANPALTPAQLTNILNGTADDIGDVNQGHGRMNVYRALAAVTGDLNPPVYKPASAQFVAFAYTNSGAINAAPTIIDITFPNGILVNPDGTFRVADMPPSASTFKIGVWYDANGNGVVDAGDRFAASAPCSQSGPCPGTSGMTATQVTGASFALP